MGLEENSVSCYWIRRVGKIVREIFSRQSLSQDQGSESLEDWVVGNYAHGRTLKNGLPKSGSIATLEACNQMG